jgi:hypothetical protein
MCPMSLYRESASALSLVRRASKDGWIMSVFLPFLITPHTYDRTQMSMHTSQHLLSAVIEKSLKVPTLTWSLTPWPSPAYIDLPRPLTAAEITRYKTKSIAMSSRDDASTSKSTSCERAKRYRPGDSEASSRELGRGLPVDYSGGVHRMVIIDGIDRTPCCGTHLPTLSTLQLFLFPSPTSSSSTSFRHYFLAGPRLLNHLGSVQRFSCGPRAPSRAAHRRLQSASPLVVEESKRREKRVDDLERELAGCWVVSSQRKWRNGALAGGEGEWVRCLSRTDDSQTAQCVLASSHSRLCSACSETGRQRANSRSYSCLRPLLKRPPLRASSCSSGTRRIASKQSVKS